MGGKKCRELTPLMTLKVSDKLTKRRDIRRLFLFLDIEENKINAIFQNNKDEIEEVVYQLMIEWRKRQRTRAEAYVTLCEALTDKEVDLSSIAYEVLKEPPSMEIQEKPISLNVRNERANDKLDGEESSQAYHNGSFSQGDEDEESSGKIEDESSPVYHTDSCRSGCCIPTSKRIFVEGSAGISKVKCMAAMVSAKITAFQFGKLASVLGIYSELMVQITARHCTNLVNEQNARFEILKCWLFNQESSEKAYVLMGDALIRAGLKLIAREIWNYPPAMNASKRTSAECDLDISSHKRTRTEMLATGL